MADRGLQVGLIGTVVTAVCCFTPVLVVLLGAAGLPWVVEYLDVILLPALACFVALLGYAAWRRGQAR